MIASVAGALVRPMPEPKSTIWAVICRYGVPADTDDAQASPAARETMPAATTILVPSRTASLVPSTELAPTVMATGSSRAPVDSGPYPFRNWKYWVTRKTKPDNAKNAIVTDPLAAVKRGLRNKPTSIIGAGARCSQPTSAASRAAAPAKPATVRADPQPCAGASITVKTSSAIPAVDSARPSRSARRARGSREVGTVTATSEKKMLDQE